MDKLLSIAMVQEFYLLILNQLKANCKTINYQHNNSEKLMALFRIQVHRSEFDETYVRNWISLQSMSALPAFSK